MIRIAPAALVTGVDPGSARAALDFTAGPNPAASSVSFRFAAASGPLRLRILDLAGREVRAFTPAPGTTEVHWDLTDAAGRRVGPGVYFGQADAGGVRATRRLVVTR